MQNFDAYQDVTTLETVAYQAPKTDADGQSAEGRARATPVLENLTTPRRRRSPWARSPRRRRSRCSAPTAAASSTPTRRIRSRTRRRCRTSCRCWRCFLIPAALVLHLRPHGGRHAPGLGGARGDAHPVRRARQPSPASSEQHGNPRLAALGVDQAAQPAAVGRQHGRQGDALRHRRLGAVRHRHHGRLERRRELRCTTRSRRSAASCRCC